MLIWYSKAQDNTTVSGSG